MTIGNYYSSSFSTRFSLCSRLNCSFFAGFSWILFHFCCNSASSKQARLSSIAVVLASLTRNMMCQIRYLEHTTTNVMILDMLDLINDQDLNATCLEARHNLRDELFFGISLEVAFPTCSKNTLKDWFGTRSLGSINLDDRNI